MQDDFIVFGSPKIEQNEIDEVVDSLNSGWLGTGPKVAKFEKKFAQYKDISASHVAALNSCTAALHVSLLTAGVKPGDEVITTPMTFCATVNAIIHSGAIPVLADISPHSFNIDPKAIEAKITKKTKAILPVHFAGRACDMDEIMQLAKIHNLKVIEDCAHAIETEYHGQKAGTMGDFGCFSFYVTKNVVTGEGGMAIAQRKEDIDRIKVLSLHGMSKDAWHRFSDSGYKHYEVIECGFKYNMMDLQAAIGIHQLARVENNWLRRKKIWNQYQEAFSELKVTRPAPPALNTRHGYHLYTLLIDREKTGIVRDEFLNQMTEHNIGIGVHYISIAEHPYYQHLFNWNPKDYPNAQLVGRNTVSLPLSPKLTNREVKKIIETTIQIINK